MAPTAAAPGAAGRGCQSVLRPRQQREAAWHWSHADQEQRRRAAAAGPRRHRREQRPLAVPCPRTCHAMRDPAVQLRRAQLLLERGGWLLRRRRGDPMRREQLHRPPVRGAVVRDLPGRCACSAATHPATATGATAATHCKLCIRHLLLQRRRWALRRRRRERVHRVRQRELHPRLLWARLRRYVPGRCAPAAVHGRVGLAAPGGLCGVG